MFGSKGSKSLTIIIVTWNCKNEIAECLRSISTLDGLPVEIETLVVDNGSRDGTAEFLRDIEATFKNIRLTVVLNSENTGLSRATQQAYDRARGNWILLCNPDVSLNPSIKEFLEYGFASPNSVIAAELANYDGSIQRAVCRRFPTLSWVFFDFSCVGSYLDKKLMNHMVRRRFTYEGEILPRAAMIESPGASFLLLNRTTITKLGLIFDPAFPIWWNDVDLAKRAEASRIPRILLTSVKMKHALSRGGSGQMEDTVRRYLFCRSLVHYAQRWKMHPGIVRILFSIDAIVSLPILFVVLRENLGIGKAIKTSMRRAALQVSGVVGA